MYRLRGMRAGVPRRGDLPRGRAAREVGAVRSHQRGVQRGHGRGQSARRGVRDGAQRPERAHRLARTVHARQIYHVAFWVADREAIVEALLARLPWHVIERTETFTLVGGDARAFKLTFFD